MGIALVSEDFEDAKVSGRTTKLLCPKAVWSHNEWPYFCACMVSASKATSVSAFFVLVLPLARSTLSHIVDLVGIGSRCGETCHSRPA